MAARVAGRQARRLGRELGEEGVGDAVVDDDLLGRHADLAGIGEGAEGGGIDRLVDIGVVEDDERRLAAEFEQHRLQIAAGGLGDDAADAGGAGEVDAADLGMGDQRLDHLGGILRRVGDQVDGALGQARLAEGLDDERMGARAALGRLEDDGVAAGERHGDRAHAEDDRRVPRRDRRGRRRPAGGWRRPCEPGRLEGMTSPVIWVVIDAASRIMSAASPTLKCDQWAGLPVSATTAAAKSSAFDCRMSAAFKRRRRRSPGITADHSGNAAAAASAAWVASLTEAAAARVATSPVTGSRRSKVRSPPAATSRSAMISLV